MLSLPVQNPTLSYWHRTTRAFPFLNANRLNHVPSSAKYVIIGSGLSGALTAWELIDNGVPGEDVLILEGMIGSYREKRRWHILTAMPFREQRAKLFLVLVGEMLAM